jgi:phage baseplate assembly protein W
MATFIGFSTQNIDKVREIFTPGTDAGQGVVVNTFNSSKKYRMTDEQLVINDFINALNIPQGQKVGRPEYGTTVWSFIFEPNTLDMRKQLEIEIRRMASLDPRLILNSVQVYPQDNGVLIEIEMAVSQFNDPMILSVMFDQTTSTATRI